MNSYPPFSHDSAPPSDHGARTDRPRRAPRVLVVDDESDLRELLEITLIGMGLDVDCAAELAQARRLLQAHRYALCLTDMRLPDGDGMELVSEIVREHAHTPVAMITAYGSTETAVSALKAGAFDFVTKPLALDALRALVRSALHLNGVAGLSTPAALAGPISGAPRAASASSPTNASSAGALTDPGVPLVDGASAASGDVEGGLIGDSAVMQALRQSIDRLARSMAPVAITGESGSGKELAARLIHQRSGRSTQPFIAVNCGAIPESLMEAEFFGYRRGAFTGADADRQGFFQAAHGGTLFLDEVADLPLAMQVKLLRAIQERKVRRLGANAEEPVDVRIVSATHQELAHCVAQGRFRQDLFYRLQVLELRMPPLRERLEDLPRLADALLARLARRSGLPVVPRLASVALRFLQTYRYPGNVRELENILERALAFSDGQVINVEDLGLQPVVAGLSENEPAAGPVPGTADPASGGDGPPSEDGVPQDLPAYLERLERDAILRALECTRQNRTAAARLLGISFRALRHRMQRLGMQ